MKNKNYPIAFIAILVITSLIVGATITGEAIKWRTRSQIETGTGEGVTKQDVLSMLNKCTLAGIQYDPRYPTCNDYCRHGHIGTTCIAASQVYPVQDESLGYISRECDFEFIFPDWDKMKYAKDTFCVCCYP